MVGQRIHVFGTSGSGKTTLARHLATRLGYPYVELDALYHLPNWREADTEGFRGSVAAATEGERWVVDGNYGKVRDLVWARADTLIWLDYPLGICFIRVLKRTVARSLRREVLWNGNRERLWVHFLSKDSLLLWVLTSHGKNRRNYGPVFAAAASRDVRHIRLRSPRETALWLARLGLG